MAEQCQFAALSGDYNPIHVDDITARRTLFGSPIVHGMHLVLVAVEHLLKLSSLPNRRLAIVSLKAEFPRPVVVGESVFFSATLADQSFKIDAYVAKDRVLDMKGEFGLAVGVPDAIIPSSHTFEKTAKNLSFAEIAIAAGTIPLALPEPGSSGAFPSARENLGAEALADLLAFTRLVGMNCPGLNSLFGGFDIRLRAASGDLMLRYKVASVDERFSLVRLAVEGRVLAGTLRTYCRPPATNQEPMLAVMDRVPRGIFKDSFALVVGGTRGLGETTAKILASGGAKVIITYNQGIEDALRVQIEIRGAGGHCEIMHLDVAACDVTIEKIFSMPDPPLSIYYFASPKIFVRRREFLSIPLLTTFSDYYVKFFTQLINLAKHFSAKSLKVFSPSSVAVQDDLRDLVEYAIAKRTAEDVSRFYNQHSSSIRIISERLPRVRTDQTATIIPYPAEEPFDVMFPIVSRIEILTATPCHNDSITASPEKG